jgi:hypothetical protein
VSCPTCTNSARCDTLGLCQVAAKEQLPGPEPEGLDDETDSGETYCTCNAEPTIEEGDWGRCGCCGKPLF